jgi:hypothetical protein
LRGAGVPRISAALSERRGTIREWESSYIYTAMGRKNDALDWLQKGYKEKDTWVVWIGVLAEWDSLRAEPRFINLLQLLKLSR